MLVAVMQMAQTASVSAAPPHTPASSSLEELCCDRSFYLLIFFFWTDAFVTRTRKAAILFKLLKNVLF